MLPGDGAKKQCGIEAVERIAGTGVRIAARHHSDARAFRVRPVMFWLPAPEMLKPGVNGRRSAAWVTPEICQPSVIRRVKALPTGSFGVVYT